MAYIYKITNLVNNKVYIGKTRHHNPLRRWAQHKNEHNKSNLAHRPLYSAMRKYGTDKFTFEVLESTELPEIRESHYILHYNSYVGFPNSNGYNATLGGDGRPYLCHTLKDAANDLINTDAGIMKISQKYKIDNSTLRNYMKINNLTYINKAFPVRERKEVHKYTLQGEYLCSYKSAREAARSLR